MPRTKRTYGGVSITPSFLKTLARIHDISLDQVIEWAADTEIDAATVSIQFDHLTFGEWGTSQATVKGGDQVKAIRRDIALLACTGLIHKLLNSNQETTDEPNEPKDRATHHFAAISLRDWTIAITPEAYEWMKTSCGNSDPRFAVGNGMSIGPLYPEQRSRGRHHVYLQYLEHPDDYEEGLEFCLAPDGMRKLQIPDERREDWRDDMERHYGSQTVLHRITFRHDDHNYISFDVNDVDLSQCGLET